MKASLRICRTVGTYWSMLSNVSVSPLLGFFLVLVGVTSPTTATAEPLSVWKSPTTCSYPNRTLRLVNAEIGVVATTEDIAADPRLACSNFTDGCFGVYWVVPLNTPCTLASQGTALYTTVEPANNTFDIAEWEAFPRDGIYRVCTSFQHWDMSGYPYSVTLLREQTHSFDSFIVKFANRSCRITPQ